MPACWSCADSETPKIRSFGMSSPRSARVAALLRQYWTAYASLRGTWLHLNLGIRVRPSLVRTFFRSVKPPPSPLKCCGEVSRQMANGGPPGCVAAHRDQPDAKCARAVLYAPFFICEYHRPRLNTTTSRLSSCDRHGAPPPPSTSVAANRWHSSAAARPSRLATRVQGRAAPALHSASGPPAPPLPAPGRTGDRRRNATCVWL
mmetsp:Transcript_43956/g.112269  ORF Transcript_43956/g.112269 Transcript_43956/m.112269 type:complete len:204 (+) Transcript_43956:317-928(+)